MAQITARGRRLGVVDSPEEQRRQVHRPGRHPHKALLPTHPRGSLWDELGEAVVCARSFYERLSTYMYLVHGYVIPAGKKNAGFPLAELSVRNYLGTAINRAGNKFRAGGSVETQKFFYCLDSNSSHESAVWFRKLKKVTTRTIFERAKVIGEAQDNSESAFLPPPRCR